MPHLAIWSLNCPINSEYLNSFVKILELKLNICTSNIYRFSDLKSTLVVYRDKTRKTVWLSNKL